MHRTQFRITFFPSWVTWVTWASLLAPVTDAEVAKTDTSFLALKALGIFLQNDPFCYNCNKWPERNSCRPFASTSNSIGVPPRGVGCINLGGRDGILRPSFLVTSFPFLLLLLLLPSLLGCLSAMGALKSWNFLFWGLGLGFFDTKILYWLGTGTNFGC